MSWVIGAGLAIFGSVGSNLGVNIQKFSFMQREKQKLLNKKSQQNKNNRPSPKSDEYEGEDEDNDDDSPESPDSPKSPTSPNSPHNKNLSSSSPSFSTNSSNKKSKSSSLSDSYWRDPKYIVGLVLVILGSVFDFAALALAALSIVTPIGSTTLVANMFFAHFWLKERLSKRDFFGTTLIIIGSSLSVSFGNHNANTYTIDELLQFYQGLGFLIYISLIGISSLLLYCCVKHIEPIKLKLIEAISLYDKAVLDYNNPLAMKLDEIITRLEKQYSKWERVHPFAYCSLSGILGAQSVLFGKMVAELISTSIRGNNQMINPFTYLFLFLMFFCVFAQLHFLALGLSYFDALYCVPVFQCFFISISTLGGAAYFLEFNDFTPIQFVMFPFGIVMTLSGVALLSMRKMKGKGHSSELRDAEKKLNQSNVNVRNKEAKSNSTITKQNREDEWTQSIEMQDFTSNANYYKGGKKTRVMTKIVVERVPGTLVNEKGEIIGFAIEEEERIQHTEIEDSTLNINNDSNNTNTYNTISKIKEKEEIKESNNTSHPEKEPSSPSISQSPRSPSSSSLYPLPVSSPPVTNEQMTMMITIDSMSFPSSYHSQKGLGLGELGPEGEEKEKEEQKQSFSTNTTTPVSSSTNSTTSPSPPMSPHKRDRSTSVMVNNSGNEPTNKGYVAAVSNTPIVISMNSGISKGFAKLENEIKGKELRGKEENIASKDKSIITINKEDNINNPNSTSNGRKSLGSRKDNVGKEREKDQKNDSTNTILPSILTAPLRQISTLISSIIPSSTHRNTLNDSSNHPNDSSTSTSIPPLSTRIIPITNFDDEEDENLENFNLNKESEEKITNTNNNTNISDNKLDFHNNPNNTTTSIPTPSTDSFSSSSLSTPSINPTALPSTSLSSINISGNSNEKAHFQRFTSRHAKKNFDSLIQTAREEHQSLKKNVIQKEKDRENEKKEKKENININNITTKNDLNIQKDVRVYSNSVSTSANNNHPSNLPPSTSNDDTSISTSAANTSESPYIGSSGRRSNPESVRPNNRNHKKNNHHSNTKMYDTYDSNQIENELGQKHNKKESSLDFFNLGLFRREGEGDVGRNSTNFKAQMAMFGAI